MFTLSNCDGKPTLRLRGRCGSIAIALGRMMRIRALELNQSRGWKGKDLTVLSRLHPLSSLKVASLKLENLNGLSSQSQLRTLSLDVSDQCAGAIDWRQMAHVQKLMVPGRLLSNLDAEMPAMEDLYLYTSCGHSEDRILRHLPHLRSLRMNFSSRVDLQTLSTPRLQRLVLGRATKLASLQGAENLGGIEHLTLDGCKALESIESLGALHQLKELHLADCNSLPSIAFLRSLPHLQKLTFPSTRILDDDLACLMTFPRLEEVDFDYRAGYNATREEVLRSFKSR